MDNRFTDLTVYDMYRCRTLAEKEMHRQSPGGGLPAIVKIRLDKYDRWTDGPQGGMTVLKITSRRVMN